MLIILSKIAESRWARHFSRRWATKEGSRDTGPGLSRMLPAWGNMNRIGDEIEDEEELLARPTCQWMNVLPGVSLILADGHIWFGVGWMIWRTRRLPGRKRNRICPRHSALGWRGSFSRDLPMRRAAICIWSCSMGMSRITLSRRCLKLLPRRWILPAREIQGLQGSYLARRGSCNAPSRFLS